MNCTSNPRWLQQFGVDHSNRLEFGSYDPYRKQRWMMAAILLAAILDFVKNKI
jgi:hypothetical protein